MLEDRWLLEQLANTRFVARYPHYAAVLAHLEVIEDPSVDVLGISTSRGRFYLHINRAFFAMRPAFLPGTILHELHHIVLGHLTEPKFRDLTNPTLLELAMEMSANEGIREPLPPHVSIVDYKEFGILPGQSTLERYELLMKAERAGASFGESRNVDDHRMWLESLSRGASDRKSVEAGRQLAGVFLKAAEEEGQGAGWLSGLLAGRSSGIGESELDVVRARPFDWRTALFRFVQLRRAKYADYTRQNRRFPHRIGEVPGRARRDEWSKPRVLVAIDTSGSMPTKVLSQIAAQLDRLRHFVVMVIVECDDQVRRVYPYSGRLRRVTGRGGTDFRPVFEPSLLNEHRPAGIVYFTDGMGNAPPRPPRIPTLWVMTSSLGPPCRWGQRVVMRTEAAT
jgi:predicted metal-dependent peptidase